MKKARGFSVLLIIPIITLVLAIAGVFIYKLYSDGVNAKAAQEKPILKITPPLDSSGKKPSTGYGTIQGPTPIVTSASGTLSGTDSGKMDVQILLDETDDGGEGDLKSLDAAVNQL